MLRYFVGTIVLLLLGLWIWNEWSLYHFTHPDRESLADEMKFLVDYQLPENAEVIVARRSRPSPLLGDYSTCALVKFSEEDFAALLKIIPYNSAAEKWLVGCPVEKYITKHSGTLNLRLYGYRERPGAEWYFLMIDERERIALFEMGIS